jgi:hypothetical protein
MPITVNLPDGSTASFPDGTPPEAMKAAIQKKFPPQGMQTAQAPAAAVAQPAPQAAPAQSPNFLDATMATVNGLTGSVPFLQEASDAMLAGGQTVGDMFGGTPDFGKRYNDIRASRERVAARAPIANTLGEIGGVLGTAGALGSSKIGAEALGMTGKFGQQMLNSALSTAGYEGLSGLSKGHTGGNLATDMGLGFGGGLAGPVVGKAVEGTGKAVADAFTRGAQGRLTSKALATGGQSGAALRREAGGYFGNSVDTENPVILNGDSYHRLLAGIQGATRRFRPNELNNPEAVGLLQKFWQVADEINAPGGNAVVDLKDLHILRQGARDVAEGGGSDQTKAIAKIVIRQTDDFIRSLKPGDIAGGADPREATNNLLRGISTWARASKVKAIEKAIADADTYKSGYENGLKLSFLKLMKTDDFARMSKVEQDAIRTVAKGTTVQNIAEGLGKLGFSLGGSSAHNIVGGSLGTAGLATALAPALGPLALPAALAGTTAVGASGRAIAEHLGRAGAERAAQIAATPGIITARQAPNLLAPLRRPVEIMVRGGIGGAR